MTRFLQTCFERLEAGEVHDAIVRYLAVSRHWPTFDLVVPASVRQMGAELWSTHPELRSALAPQVLYTVCHEYRRVFRRVAETHDELDHAAWLASHPELGAQIHPFVVERAKRFRQTQAALRASLVWARHLDGGDVAWLQLANVWRWGWRNGELKTESHLRPELTRAEAERVNAHLLEDERVEPYDRRRDEADLGSLLQNVILAARAVGAHLDIEWADQDDQRYAEALRKLPARAQHQFRTKRCTKPLKMIAALAESL